MSGTVNRERLHPGRQTIDRADELRLPDIEPDGTRFIGPLASWAIEPPIIRREPGRTHTHISAERNETSPMRLRKWARSEVRRNKMCTTPIALRPEATLWRGLR